MPHFIIIKLICIVRIIIKKLFKFPLSLRYAYVYFVLSVFPFLCLARAYFVIGFWTAI